MTQKDYDRFLHKVDQLNKLVKFINDSSERYKLFIRCKTHEEVVNLAEDWGFEIGRRWGEP